MNQKKRYTDWADLPLVMTLEEVAGVLNKGYETITKWAREGMIPATKISDKWVVEKNALMKALGVPETEEKPVKEEPSEITELTAALKQFIEMQNAVYTMTFGRSFITK